MSCADSALVLTITLPVTAPVALESQGTPVLLGDSPKYAVLFSCRSSSSQVPLV